MSEEEKARARQELLAADEKNRASGKEGVLEAALEAREAEEAKASLGLDLEFDPKEFITSGIIARKGIKVNDKMFVDMKTLSTKDRMLAEALVKEKYGVMKLDAVYLTAIEAAMLAVAITRVNNQPFPMPPEVVTTKAEQEDFDAAYAGKKRLFDTFLEANNDFVSLLSYIYKNLENIAQPSEEVLKKS
jgi:hypothetical protein